MFRTLRFKSSRAITRLAAAIVLTFFMFLLTRNGPLSLPSLHLPSYFDRSVGTQYDMSGVLRSSEHSQTTLNHMSPVEVLPSGERALRAAQLRINYSSIMMSPMEVDMVLRYIHWARTYLEWGSGGSTTNFAQFAKSKAVSIEHNEPWYKHMVQIVQANSLLARLDFRLVHIPPGHHGWGRIHAFEEGNYIQFKEYVNEIDNVGIPLFDFVLVDGRARVDCAIKALSYIHNGSSVALHDSERMKNEGNESYNSVLDYYDQVEFVGGHKRQGISILQRKPKFYNLQANHAAVKALLDAKYPGS